MIRAQHHPFQNFRLCPVISLRKILECGFTGAQKGRWCKCNLGCLSYYQSNDYGVKLQALPGAGLSADSRLTNERETSIIAHLGHDVGGGLDKRDAASFGSPVAANGTAR